MLGTVLDHLKYMRSLNWLKYGIKKEVLRDLSIVNYTIDSIMFSNEALQITPEISMIFNLNYMKLLDLHPKLKYVIESMEKAVDISKNVSKTLTTANNRNSAIISNNSTDNNLNNKKDKTKENTKSTNKTKNISSKTDDILKNTSNNSTTIATKTIDNQSNDIADNIDNQSQKLSSKTPEGNVQAPKKILDENGNRISYGFNSLDEYNNFTNQLK